MGYLGEKIKEAREAKGVTISKAAEATKIKSDYLKALETEDFDRLPPRAYVKGFLKIYAHYLGLEYELLLGFMEETYSDSQPEVVFADTGKTRAIPFLPGIKISTILGILGAVILAVLLISGLVRLMRGWGSGGSGDDLEVADPPFTRETIERITLPADPGAESGAPSDLNLTARAARRMWLEVRADGTLVFFGNLPAGGSVSWKAKKEYRVKAPPDPEGLTLLLNGERLSLPAELSSDRILKITGRGLGGND